MNIKFDIRTAVPRAPVAPYPAPAAVPKPKPTAAPPPVDALEDPLVLGPFCGLGVRYAASVFHALALVLNALDLGWAAQSLSWISYTFVALLAASTISQAAVMMGTSQLGVLSFGAMGALAFAVVCVQTSLFLAERLGPNIAQSRGRATNLLLALLYLTAGLGIVLTALYDVNKLYVGFDHLALTDFILFLLADVLHTVARLFRFSELRSRGGGAVWLAGVHTFTTLNLSLPVLVVFVVFSARGRN